MSGGRSRSVRPRPLRLRVSLRAIWPSVSLAGATASSSRPRQPRVCLAFDHDTPMPRALGCQRDHRRGGSWASGGQVRRSAWRPVDRAGKGSERLIDAGLSVLRAPVMPAALARKCPLSSTPPRLFVGQRVRGLIFGSCPAMTAGTESVWVGGRASPHLHWGGHRLGLQRQRALDDGRLLAAAAASRWHWF